MAECRYLEGYGLTETSIMLSLNTTKFGVKHGSVGKLLPHVMVKTIPSRLKKISEGMTLDYFVSVEETYSLNI